jgi:hypothetical protein
MLAHLIMTCPNDRMRVVVTDPGYFSSLKRVSPFMDVHRTRCVHTACDFAILMMPIHLIQTPIVCHRPTGSVFARCHSTKIVQYP